jgi:hypothetical protein
MGSDLAPNEVYAMAAALIESRDTAIRLALLDELIALDDGSEDTLTVYRAVAMLRAKYEMQSEIK